MSDRLTTYVEASRELGVNVLVIATLAKAHELKAKPVPRNGKAKGLDEADMRVLRKALGMPARQPARQPQPQ
jgi:hypothetical protein